MKKLLCLACTLLMSRSAFSASALPGDRELLASYCVVVVNNTLRSLEAFSRWQAETPATKPEQIEAANDAIADMKDKKERLASFLRPVLVAAQEANGSAYAAALLEAQNRAERDVENVKSLTDAPGKRLARCADLSWLP